MYYILFRLHFAVTILFSICYFLSILLQRLVFSQYADHVFLNVNNQAFDLLFLILYLLIYRPRVFPQYFNIEYNNSEENGNIYICNLPNLNSLRTTNDLDLGFINKRKEKITKNSLKNINSMPLIIVNPIFDSEMEFNEKPDINISSSNINGNEPRSNSFFSTNSNLNDINIKSSFTITDRLSVGFLTKK